MSNASLTLSFSENHCVLNFVLSLDGHSNMASWARVSLSQQLLGRLKLDRAIDLPKVKEVNCRVDVNAGMLAPAPHSVTQFPPSCCLPYARPRLLCPRALGRIFPHSHPLATTISDPWIDSRLVFEELAASPSSATQPHCGH